MPHWEEIALRGLASTDAAEFGSAAEAARALGIDTWDHHFVRLQRDGGNGWYFVMQTDDPTRIDRVVALAEEVLPLERIATGPAEELGLGREWVSHGHLDFVLQDLRRFPEKGWRLIRTGLRSPVIRNRHMALHALSPWGKTRWPADAELILRAALAEEPNEGVRINLERLLAGEPLETAERG